MYIVFGNIDLAIIATPFFKCIFSVLVFATCKFDFFFWRTSRNVNAIKGLEY